MTYIDSSNKDIDFPIPDETRVCYRNEFACAMTDTKHTTLMLPDNVKYVGIGPLEFDKKVLKYIIDRFPTTQNLTNKQRDVLIFRTNSISSVQNTEMSTNSGPVESGIFYLEGFDTDDGRKKKRITSTFLSGELSPTLIISIEISRKYGLKEPSNVIIEKTEKGILIRKLVV